MYFLTLLFFDIFFRITLILSQYGGVIIKKNIGVIILAVSLCVVFSKALFSTYRSETVMSMDGNIYYLQYGSYVNYNVMEEAIKKIDDYIIYEEDGKYYVYVGAFIRLENAQKMQKIFEEENIYTYIKNEYLGNKELYKKIEKLDYNVSLENDLRKTNKKIMDILKKA